MTKTISWDDDKIGGRKEAAEYLTKFMCDAFARNTKDEAFVVSLNAPWGFGKTFFLERWADDLRGAGHPVVYFDAWKTDFSNQPLLTFIVEFCRQTFEQLGDIYRTDIAVTTQIDRISNAVLPILKDVVKHFTGVDLEQMSFGGLLEEYEKKINGIKEFRKQIEALSELFKGNNQTLPIFVFVDEMDRCRPDYAIELLESIKHIFSSRNLCFVVATDTGQLSESIKAVYGLGFDANRYLHRFFSQEYRLPEPDNTGLASYLFEIDSIDDICLFNPSKESKQSVFAKLADLHKLSIREQIKAYELLRAFVLSDEGKRIDMFFATALIMLKLAKSEDFDKLANERLPQEQVVYLYENGDYNTKVWISDIKIAANAVDRQENIKLQSVIGFYMRFIDCDLLQKDMDPEHQRSKNRIYRRIIEFIIEKKPRQYTIGTVQYPDIHDYPARISRIGQLIEVE